MAATKMVARRSFDYAGTALDQGQVFLLANAPHDERLLRLGYVEELRSKAETHRCAECGAEFVGHGERTRHGRYRHQPEPTTEVEAERRLESKLSAEERMAPLYLDQTAAARR